MHAGVQFDPGLFLGCVAFLEFLLGDHHAFFHQRLDVLEDGFLIQQVGDVPDGQGALDLQALYDEEFLVVEPAVVAVPAAVEYHLGLAGQSERAGQCGAHDFSGGAHVVVRHPFPQAQLAFGHDGFVVEYRLHVFGLVLGRVFVDGAHDGGVALGFAELHHHAHAGQHLLVHPVWNAVGQLPGNGQGQDDIGKVGAPLHVRPPAGVGRLSL